MIVEGLLVIGVILMLLSAWLGLRNYRATRYVSNYWLYFSLAMMSGIAAWILFMLSHTNVVGPQFRNLRRTVFIVFFTLLVVAGIDRVTTNIGEITE